MSRVSLRMLDLALEDGRRFPPNNPNAVDYGSLMDLASAYERNGAMTSGPTILSRTARMMGENIEC